MVFQIRKSFKIHMYNRLRIESYLKYCIYRTYKKDTFYDVTDALDMQNMEKIETRYREKKGVENKGTENLTYTIISQNIPITNNNDHSLFHTL